MSSKEDRKKLFASAYNIRESKESIELMHSDEVLDRIYEDIELAMSFNILLQDENEKLMSKDEYKQFQKNWKKEFVKRFPNEPEPDSNDEVGWVFLLSETERKLTYRSAKDFNSFARQNYDALIKQAVYTSKYSDIESKEEQDIQEEVKHYKDSE